MVALSSPPKTTPDPSLKRRGGLRYRQRTHRVNIVSGNGLPMLSRARRKLRKWKNATAGLKTGGGVSLCLCVFSQRVRRLRSEVSAVPMPSRARVPGSGIAVVALPMIRSSMVGQARGASDSRM